MSEEAKSMSLYTLDRSTTSHCNFSTTIHRKMKSFSSQVAALLLLSLLATPEGRVGSIFTRQHKDKLSEFQERLESKAAFGLPNPKAKTPKQQQKEGRVFYPIGYGADPSGQQESSDAILRAVDDAFNVETGLELLPGIKDLGGLVIDFQGGSYKISKPISFPPVAGNILVKGGSLRASEAFPGDRHLIELWSPNSVTSIRPHIKVDNPLNSSKQQNVGIYYEDITFRDILFDSSYRGGGIFIIDSARIRINNCFFLHFTTQGVMVQRGHETFISSCFLGQHPSIGGDRNERDYTGTAVDLASNDNAITDVVIFSASIGVVLRGQANMVTGVHCYNKATYFGGVGILVKLAGNSQTRIDNCYLDYNAIVMEDPVQVHVTNGFFLGDANVVLKSVKGKISGLNVVDNMFVGDPKRMNPIVQLDGEFTSIDQAVIERNNVAGMSLRSTVGKLTVAGNGTKWVADFTPVLVFPDRINHFQYSFYVKATTGAPQFAGHAVTNVSNNVVVVQSDKAVNGVVSVVVDQYSMAGEENFLV